MELAVEALKAGAFDFVSKPLDLTILRNLVTSAIKLPRATADIVPDKTSKYNLLGESSTMQTLRKKISKLARSQAPIFINGESGSGKELAAHLIHEQGARAEQPFIPVNCGAIPAELMESEFFGHKKGSFSGASSDKDGLFKAANGGTLFLDEVADLPLHMQVKLLRAIQEKAIRAVGDLHEENVDVRILSASHKDLAQLVEQGKFRQDLYYRINVIELSIPSLRERSDDIPMLADFLLSRQVKKSGFDSKPVFSDAATKALMNHDFPGNVRELENILERALALAENDVIQVSDLQLLNNNRTELKAKPAPFEKKQAKALSTLMVQEKESIMQALEQTRWNKTAAAKLLGLTLRQLRYRLNKLNIE